MRRQHVFVTGYSTGGAIAVVLGAAHFFLPTWGYDELVLQSIPEIPRDHFVYLGTYAIGLFLVSVGVMSFHFAKVGGGQTAKLFAALQAVFWAVRVLLEVLFPSHLQIFFLSDPPIALGALSVIARVSYSAAFIAAKDGRALGSHAIHRGIKQKGTKEAKGTNLYFAKALRSLRELLGNQLISRLQRTTKRLTPWQAISWVFKLQADAHGFQMHPWLIVSFAKAPAPGVGSSYVKASADREVVLSRDAAAADAIKNQHQQTSYTSIAGSKPWDGWGLWIWSGLDVQAAIGRTRAQFCRIVLKSVRF